MAAARHILAIALAALSNVPAALAQQRPIGEAYFECRAQLHFALPGRDGKPALFADLTRPKRPPVPHPVPEGPELLEIAAVVEADGSITRLTMAWMQSGLLGFPYWTRADLDGVSLYAGFGGDHPMHPLHKIPPQSRFDPEQLFVSVRVQQIEKIKQPMTLELSRLDDDGERLGGLAEIPAWRQSAEIGMWWRDLQSFARGADQLRFERSQLVVGDHGLEKHPDRAGLLDLSVMPAVIARFSEGERIIQAKAAERTTQCIKQIEQEVEIDDPMPMPLPRRR